MLAKSYATNYLNKLREFVRNKARAHSFQFNRSKHKCEVEFDAKYLTLVGQLKPLFILFYEKWNELVSNGNKISVQYDDEIQLHACLIYIGMENITYARYNGLSYFEFDLSCDDQKKIKDVGYFVTEILQESSIQMANK